MKIFILKMPYSIPYILLICFFLLIATFQLGVQLDQKTRRYLNYIVILTYILFFGFRGFIGWDWYNYYPFYKNIKIGENLLQNQNNISDYGFIFFAALIKYLFKSYDSFILINTLINIILLNAIFNRYLDQKYHAFGYALFLAFNGLFLEVDLLRNVKALLIFLIAIQYIEERKPLPYFALIILAFLFHWSAIFYAPLYFFLHKPISLKAFLIILVIGNLIFIFQIEYLKPIIRAVSSLFPDTISTKINHYLDIKIYSRPYGFTLGFFERTIMSLFILLYYNKLVQIQTNILFINSFLIYICLYLFCSEVSIILSRVAINFVYSYWILIPIILQKMDKGSKPIFYLFYCLLIILKINIMTNNIFYNYQSSLLSNRNSYTEQLEIFNKNYKSLLK
ncbi:MAG TPA: EpsG family protein [Paludibacteraceae bacterium]|nr:EpsG family protein [Paludibacteraceae bacterium]